MVFSVVFIFLLILLLLLILFFMFVILLPAMKRVSFSVENPLFSELELKYVIPEIERPKDVTMHAVVLCSSNKKFSNQQCLDYNPGQSCKTVSQIYESINDCRFSCIGLGDCVNSCPQEAIVIKNNTAVVTNLCCGCGNCVEECPKHIIKLMRLETNECQLCCNVDESLTHCSDCKKTQNIEIPVKRGFKIWETCYRIITGVS